MAFIGATAPSVARWPNRSFFSPWVDFLCLGGGSLIALPILGLLIPDGAAQQAGICILVLSFLINYPHFVHSYQIFYGSYDQVMGSSNLDRTLRRRYLWAGFALPMLFVAYFALALSGNAPAMLRYAVNAMVFLSGWHYVKQGYGMLMIDAALKHNFFSATAKKLLMINAYACWALSWMLINRLVEERNFLGLSYYTLHVPGALIVAAAFIAGGTTLLFLGLLVQQARKPGCAFPINGTAAYIASLYLWLFLRSDPELLVLIPAFHSLQYLLIVWRYRMNIETAKPDAEAPSSLAHVRNASLRFLTFTTTGIALGFYGFYLVPTILDNFVPYNHDQFGHRLFLFIFWVSINIHHYFIDHAMWRKENPFTLPHLLSHR
jgi:hypothetical protein